MPIIVQRNFRLAPRDIRQFEQQSAQGLWPTFLHFGSKMLAFGTWAFGGRSDEVATNTAYADFEHWLATRQQFHGRPGAFYEDQSIMEETKDLRAIFEGRNRLVLTSNARFIEVNDEVSALGVAYRRPGDAPAEAPPTFGRRSVISERTYQLNAGAESEFLRLSWEHIWPWLNEQGGRMVAYGHDPLGASDEVITLFAFRSLVDWQRLSRPAAGTAAPEVSQAWQDRAALIRRHRGRLLVVGTDFGAAV